MQLINYEFQTEAEDKLTELVIDALNSKESRNDSNNILFSSCVASGKTKMMSTVMKRVAEEYDDDVAFIFMTLSKGGLDVQARTDLKSYGEQEIRFLTVEGLVTEATAEGRVPSHTCTVIGWDSVNRDANRQMKDGEKPTFKSVMKKNRGKTKIVLFVDEAHSNLTWKSREVKALIYPYAIVMATATPRMKKKDFSSSEYKVIVNPDEVARAGKIKNTVIVNDGGLDSDDVFVGDYSWRGLIEAGMKRRDVLERAYRSVGTNITPLVVIQLPNDSETDKGKRETASNVAEAKDILVDELGYNPDEDVLVWTAQEKDPAVANVVNSKHKALITKLAVSTGWDCPRAQVLVKLRKTGSDVLDIQTLGRIYRTADPTKWLTNKDYSSNKMLNTAWVYCDDEDYDPSVAGLRIIDPKLQIKVRPEFGKDLDRIHLVRIVAGTRRILGGKTAAIVEDIIKLLNDCFPYEYERGKGSWSFSASRRRVARGRLEVKKMYDDLEKSGEALTGHDYIDINDDDIEEYTYDKVRRAPRLKRYQHEIQAAIKRHTIENLCYDGDFYKYDGGEEDEGLYEKRLRDLCRAINSVFTQAFIPRVAHILDMHSDYQEDMIYDGRDSAHPLWTPPMVTYSTRELEKTADDSTYAYNRINKFDSNSEKKFAHEVLAKEMDMWFKNEPSTADAFCLSWDDDKGNHRGFFPDFISIKGSTLYITEVKGGKDISQDNSLKPSDDKGKAIAINKWLTSKDKRVSIDACADIDDIVFGICRLIQDDWRIYVGDGTDYEDTTNLEAWRLLTDVIAEQSNGVVF